MNQARPSHAPPPGGSVRKGSVQGRKWKNGEHASHRARVRVMQSRDRREGVGCESRSTARPGRSRAAPIFWRSAPTASCSIAACSIPTGSTPNSPNRQLSFDPRALDAVIVSHAHNDHIGRLPCLIRAGYNGPIYTTPATGDIASVMLRDSARIQREEVAQRPRPATPHRDARAPLRPGRRRVGGRAAPAGAATASRRRSCPGVTLTYLDAGHILGSAIVQLDYRENGRTAGSSSPATWAGGTRTSCPTPRSSRTSTSWSPRAPTATASSTPTTG